MKKKLENLVSNKVLDTAPSMIADINGALIDVSPKNEIENIIESYETALEMQQESAKKSEGQIVIKKRFIDNMAMLKKADNFIHRKHFGKTAPLFVAYVVVFVLSMIFLLINEQNSILVLIVALLIGAACLVNVHFLKKFNRINNAIEFQNYIFANALRSDNEYCIIFNEDGDVVYTDPRIQKLEVSEEAKKVHDLDLLLMSFEVDDSKIQAVKDAIFKKKIDENQETSSAGDLLALTLSFAHPKKGSFVINVNQLEHPVGYTVLKMTKNMDNKGI